jgi:urea transport system permease protein
VLVTLYLPNGVLGLMGKLRMKKRVPTQAKAPEAATVTGDHA